MVSSKANITLEKNLIDDVKKFIKQKKASDNSFPHNTPTALIREAIRAYIYPDSETKISEDEIEKLVGRIESIEKKKEALANAEQMIYIKGVATIIGLFDDKHDFYEVLKILQTTLSDSNLSPVEFREFTRIDIEKSFLENLANPPDELKDVVQTKPLLQLLMMFLFLCNLGFTRKEDIIDPLAPMSMMFLDSLKKMIKK
jgi:hypothetical protein